jgi:Ca2+-transporting ATPase
MLDEEALRDTPWRTHTADEVISAFETDVGGGLSAEEAGRRLERFGPNEIRSDEALPWWTILWRQFAGGSVLRGARRHERDER